MAFDLAGIAPMQWVLAVNPAQLSTSQTLTIKHGQRSVDGTNRITVEPGVYVLEWDTNLPDGIWKSFYFRDPSNFETAHANFGSLNPSGRQRVVVPRKTHLYCYATLNTRPSAVDPVEAITLIPTAPLATAFGE